ncbi:uncharacterized protein LOC134830314 [Culicoides brevitarsis]|uniref:uncharacterized protein LOC134830314 n=1 Tax=Culicoides brevitarsis TaxID=469753 RepID=UPI00307B2D76
MLRAVLSRLGTQTNDRNSKIILENARLFASFRNRDFQLDGTDVESSGSLITRFARHVAIQNASNKDPIKYTIRYADYFPVADMRRFIRDIREIDAEQLPQMIVYTSVYKGRTDIPTIVEVVNRLDNECAAKIEEMSQQRIIEVLNALMYFLPDRIHQLDFFKRAMPTLVNGFGKEQNARTFVEVCFYLGMGKKSEFCRNLMQQFLKNYLDDYADELETMDLAIVANAAFKTSTQLKSQTFLRRVKEAVLSMEEIDMALMITFLKCLRHNQVRSPETLAKVIGWLENGQITEENSDIRSIGHLLAFLAENRVAHNEIVSDLFIRGIQLVNSGTLPRYISTLLWSASQLGLTFTDEVAINRVVQIIFNKLDNGEYRYASDELIVTSLSLWLLGYKYTDLAKDALADTDTNFQKMAHRVRQDSRRILLQNLLDLERKPLKINRKPSEYLINDRPALQMTFETLKKCAKEFNFSSVEYVQQIPELNIAGICAKIGPKDLHVEVFDNTNTLNDNKTPIGLMRLKKRILEDKKCAVLIVNAAGLVEKEQIEELVKTEIRDFLDDHSDDEKISIET